MDFSAFISEITQHDHLFELFAKNDIPGLQEALRCFFNKPGCEAIPGVNPHTPMPLILSPVEETHGWLELSLNSHDAVDRHAPVASHSSSEDFVAAPRLINSLTPSSSSEPPSFPQRGPPSPVASDASNSISSGFPPNGAPCQDFIKPPTPTRPSAARVPRSPLEARNTFKPNVQYPKPYQLSSSSHIPTIQGADVFSGRSETENQDPSQNPLNSTTTIFAPPTFQHMMSNQSSQPAMSVAKFHDKVAPSQIPNCVLTKSQKLARGMRLEGGQQDINGRFWKLAFSISGLEDGSRLEYICNNPQSPDCRQSTSQLGDMSRHQQGSTHLPPNSNTLTCSLCGHKLNGIRSDAMKRHQGLRKCRTKRVQVQGAKETALSGLDVPSTSRVGEKRGWADMAGDEVWEDEHPAKVSKYENTNSISSPQVYPKVQA